MEIDTGISKVQEFQAFFDRCRAVKPADHTHRSAPTFITDFTRFREQFIKIKAGSAARELREAPAYNIFHILGAARAEVSTHSAFLAHLLSPTASHGQSFLFLHSFLQHCKGRYPDFPDLPPFADPRSWLALTEMFFHSGRMDIVIQNPVEGFLCVIENKVDCGEGWDQLVRYSRWLEEHRQTYPHQALCFLTITGASALTAGGMPYFPLSYHKDIAGWLEDVLDHIQAPGVRAVVHQYQAIVANL